MRPRVGLPLAILAASAAVLFNFTISSAQSTNREIFEELARECLTETTDTLHAFRLAAPDTMPYVRAALASEWNAGGKRVYVDGLPAETLPVLRYVVRHASVAYDRRGAGAVERDVRLTLHATLTRADGSVLDDHLCTLRRTQSLQGIHLSDLEDPLYPETRGDPPRGGWIRRYLEPVVTVGAIAVGIFLFFSLRSS